MVGVGCVGSSFCSFLKLGKRDPNFPLGVEKGEDMVVEGDRGAKTGVNTAIKGASKLLRHVGEGSRPKTGLPCRHLAQGQLRCVAL